MKPWQFAVMGLACLVVAGCRTDPNIALLERDLRLQEDEIYRLRGLVEDYQGDLQAYRDGASGTAESGREPDELPALPQLEGIPSASEIRSSPGRAYGDPESEAPPSPYKEPSEPTDQPDRPGGSGQSGPAGRPGDLEPPMLDWPDAGGADDGAEVHSTSQIGPVLSVDSRQVSQLVLNRQFTGGYDRDGRPGDDGITLAVELLDDRGRPVTAPGDVAVVLLDPALDDDDARVGRWDFSAGEMAAGMEGTTMGPALRLELPWLAGPPAHGQLHLFVRYTTSDGRDLQADCPIEIALPGQTANRWVPAKPGSPALAASPATGLLRSDQVAAGAGQPPPAAGQPASPPPATEQVARPNLKRPVWSPYR